MGHPWSSIVLAGALTLACSPSVRPVSPDPWASLPAFEETNGGRAFALAVESKWRLPIRSLRIGIDGTRFWELRGPVGERVTKPVTLGPGDHELSLVGVVDGTGDVRGYTFEVKSAHRLTPDTAETTLNLVWDPDGAALEDHFKVTWVDAPHGGPT